LQSCFDARWINNVGRKEEREGVGGGKMIKREENGEVRGKGRRGAWEGGKGRGV